MPAPRLWRRSTNVFLAGVIISFILFYPFQKEGQGTPKFLSTPFRTVTTVTQYKTVTTSVVPVPTPTRTKLGKHTYRRDGLLEVNYGGPHPILELIKRAEKDWEAKSNRASKNLLDAVVEYRRRYNRDPPRGFDIWCVVAILFSRTLTLICSGGNTQ
jgi:hypothetical protein